MGECTKEKCLFLTQIKSISTFLAIVRQPVETKTPTDKKSRLGEGRKKKKISRQKKIIKSILRRPLMGTTTRPSDEKSKPKEEKNTISPQKKKKKKKQKSKRNKNKNDKAKKKKKSEQPRKKKKKKKKNKQRSKKKRNQSPTKTYKP